MNTENIIQIIGFCFIIITIYFSRKDRGEDNEKQKYKELREYIEKEFSIIRGSIETLFKSLSKYKEEKDCDMYHAEHDKQHGMEAQFNNQEHRRIENDINKIGNIMRGANG